VAQADFGDHRLDDRVAVLLSDLGNHPTLSIPAACGGRAETKAADRFFDNDKVTFDKVLEPHVARTKERIAPHPVVFLVQDTAEADLTRPAAQVAGAGDLDGARRGVLVQAMQAFTPEGTPLGTVWAALLNRTAGVAQASLAEKESARKHTPIEAKQSQRWLTGLRAARPLAQHLPAVQCIGVADSAADIYERFAAPRGARPVHWLIRACQDRALDGGDAGPHLRAQVLAAPVLCRVQRLIRGRQAKTAAEDRARRQSRDARPADVEVRAAAVTVRPPWRPDRQLPPATVNVVLVREPDPPPGEPAVEWLLVTTLPIDTPEQVRTVVAYYCVRWAIEISHPHYPSSNSLYRDRRAA
jgi:hypothetical protein